MLRIDNAIANVHAKAACYLCLRGSNLVDTEVTIEYEGVLAICTACVHDMAMVAGWDVDITHDEIAKYQDDLAEANYIADSILSATTQVQQTLADVRKQHRDRLRRYRQRMSGRD